VVVDREKLRIAKLAIAHDVSRFESGSRPLDRYISLHALQSQRANVAQTYVAFLDEQVVGYHTLVVGEIVYDDAPERLVKGIPRHPVPIVLLARLAVAQSWQGRGLGAALVVDATRRVLQVSEIVGVRAMAVHAKDESAKRFYEHLGFEPFPAEPFTLYRLLKDIRTMLGCATVSKIPDIT
jgi:GNAT superfamily N-acetyltransferase